MQTLLVCAVAWYDKLSTASSAHSTASHTTSPTRPFMIIVSGGQWVQQVTLMAHSIESRLLLQSI